MLQIHSQLAQDMGMARNNIAIADNGSVIEITPKTIKVNGTVPAGEVYVDGSGVGDVGAVVMRDRKRPGRGRHGGGGPAHTPPTTARSSPSRRSSPGASSM